MPVLFAHRRGDDRRRGAVCVFAMITLPVLLGFAALSVDLGYLYVARTELQKTADAAALAGASAYRTDAGPAQNYYILTGTARQRARTVAAFNPVLGRSLELQDADVRLGRHDFQYRTGPLLPVGRWNAVQVTSRRTGQSPNGPVPLFFAGIFGRYASDLAASARAAADDRMAGYRFDDDGVFMPFVIDEWRYNDLMRTGPDDYSYDSGVTRSPDGVRELSLFPWADWKLSQLDGAGNFGTLCIGAGSNGTSLVEVQIRDGVTTTELQATFGTSELIFYDADHTAQTGPRIHYAPGNPGLSVGFRDELTARIGDTVGFFLHRGVTLDGSNATFAISGVAFGRLMAINLTGALSKRSLVIQPVAWLSDSVITGDVAPSTNSMVARLALVQ